MKTKILILLIGMVLLIGIGTAGILSVTSNIEVSKSCYQILLSKGITTKDVTLKYLFEKNGNDYFSITGGELSKSFYVKSSLSDSEKTATINTLKVQKIEEWCLEQNEKYNDVPLIIGEKK